MKHLPLSAEMHVQGLEVVAKLRADLEQLLGKPLRRFDSITILQSDDGPTWDFADDTATLIIGPNATFYEPTFVANLAHECVHLHVSDGTRGNASGLEEGFAVHFELSVIEQRYGTEERDYFISHLPKTYVTALNDYQRLTKLRDDAAAHVRRSLGKLTGISPHQLRKLFPGLGWFVSYRLARRKRMRRG